MNARMGQQIVQLTPPVLIRRVHTDASVTKETFLSGEMEACLVNVSIEP